MALQRVWLTIHWCFFDHWLGWVASLYRLATDETVTIFGFLADAFF